ncbi:MAG: RagB/SusD family nutrient uptake outer membrane protein [Gemmatimonadota bacterium]|nr:MAG: RagB/SusD family nutrient uptake outer membrane protein [Gemmatimonadota bacterium]
MIKIRMFAPLLGLLVLAACEDAFNVEDFNNEGLETLLDNPSRSGIGAAATGLLITVRDEFDDRNGYVSLLGILGRESYNFDGSDPRFITEMLEGDLNPSSPAFGGNLWGERYANIRTGAIILGAVEAISDAELSPEEKEATRGYAKTMMAHELLLVVNAHDANGAVIDVPTDPSVSPGPIVTKTEVLDRIEQWLDEAADHLSDGGAAFPFTLSSGFTGFDTPPTFREFNRALAARVNIYTEDYGEALDDLEESFLDLGAPLDLGVYVVFGSTPGDEPNDLYDPGSSPDIVAHPSLVTDAQSNGLGEIDLRAQRKLRSVTSQTQGGITTDVAFNIYAELTAPIPFIRNEELILLRAEANIGEGAINLAASDLNFLRQESGGLDERTDLNAGNIEDELLYNRRYSLMFEGGHRWIDARRFGRLDELPLDTPNSQVNSAFPIPEAECLARGLEASLGGACQ